MCLYWNNHANIKSTCSDKHLTIADYLLKTFITSLTFFITLFCTLQASAAINDNYSYATQITFNHGDSLVESQLLAENGAESNSDTRSGGLIIPGADGGMDKEKKCVTVCDEWGRDCIVNPRTGARKCRRMCKAFAQECI